MLGTSFFGKGDRQGRCGLERNRVLFLFACALAGLLVSSPARGQASYTFMRVAGYADLDVTFSYDAVEEKKVLSRIGPVAQGGRILLWWLACSRTVAIYKPFLIAQGDRVVSPVLCVDRIYSCDLRSPDRGNVYRGYLYLEKGFDLSRPVRLTLGDRTIEGTFAAP
jgi:hypothetical protein